MSGTALASEFAVDFKNFLGCPEVYTFDEFGVPNQLVQVGHNFKFGCDKCQDRNNVISNFRGKNMWLSNFYMAPVLFEGLLYPSTEHAYQAAKTLDHGIRQRFLRLTAGQAKKLGNNRSVVSLRPDWEEAKFQVMSTVVWFKFWDHEDLCEKLLNTGDKQLIEGNDWGDSCWGVTASGGENNLGRILMETRESLRKVAT